MAELVPWVKQFVVAVQRFPSPPLLRSGRETVHDVKNYSVDTLDKLIVRLVTEELAKLGT